MMPSFVLGFITAAQDTPLVVSSYYDRSFYKTVQNGVVTEWRHLTDVKFSYDNILRVQVSLAICRGYVPNELGIGEYQNHQFRLKMCFSHAICGFPLFSGP